MISFLVIKIMVEERSASNKKAVLSYCSGALMTVKMVTKNGLADQVSEQFKHY